MAPPSTTNALDKTFTDMILQNRWSEVEVNARPLGRAASPCSRLRTSGRPLAGWPSPTAEFLPYGLAVTSPVNELDFTLGTCQDEALKIC